MVQDKFEHKNRDTKPVLAICYDFDKTLSPENMQAQGYIQGVGYDVDEFWKESNKLAENNDMDQNLAYMYLMVQAAHGKILLTKDTLKEYGTKVSLFPGVEDWFRRISEYGKAHGVIIEHYIISSGLKEMIEGIKPAQEGAFERIYASSFYYDERNVPIWPAQVVNFTNKTQFLFRIEKGVLDVNDSAVNDYYPSDKIRIPFRNIVYIGDSETDIPCMKLVNVNGGFAIGVYNPYNLDKKNVYQMEITKRIKFFAPADYSEGQSLDILIKKIIDRTVANEELENIYYKNKNEAIDEDKKNSEEEKTKYKLLQNLKNSGSFANTHAVISKMTNYHWSLDQKEKIFNIAINNRQVNLILTDSDVKDFYQGLLDNFLMPNNSDAEEIRRIFSEDIKGF